MIKILVSLLCTTLLGIGCVSTHPGVMSNSSLKQNDIDVTYKTPLSSGYY